MRHQLQTYLIVTIGEGLPAAVREGDDETEHKSVFCETEAEKHKFAADLHTPKADLGPPQK